MATYETKTMSGVIEPRQTQTVDLTLKTEILGTVRTNLIIKLDGHHINTMIVIVANSIGPIVSVDKQELEYGNVEVLKDYPQKIKITNKS